jgi:hypothetical protein
LRDVVRWRYITYNNRKMNQTSYADATISGEQNVTPRRCLLPPEPEEVL